MMKNIIDVVTRDRLKSIFQAQNLGILFNLAIKIVNGQKIFEK